MCYRSQSLPDILSRYYSNKELELGTSKVVLYDNLKVGFFKCELTVTFKF